ncbi:glycosyltransferase [Desulfurivibrio dismutans]|uniref:glycosyltransferase n=1 Tax=Desulfurivibrio dismutans TaxID=1398908 RepID=UPI0023DAECCA|nr:glycosyltransferase [Desulfurivibrio alkaliphilus]MDF1614082.1 glycosyltransferase [Desulfurivibrio alkaliphilus]
MNICMFTNTYLPHVGGVARSVSCFAQDLRRLGHQVLVIAPTFPDQPEDEDPALVLRVPAIQNFNGSDFSASIPAPWLINKRVDEFAPDVIHSHHPYLLGDAAMRAGRHRDLPVIFTHHTRYEEYAHYVLSSETMQNFVINLATAYANGCSRVIAPSDSIAELIKERGVKVPVEVIPTGVDVQRYQQGDGGRFRQKAGIAGDVELIGHVGRLAPEKNLDFLASAVKIHLQQNPGAKFLVVGDGPGATELKESFARDDLSDQLIMAGKKTGDDLVDAYCAMDIFVFSSHSETQGLVVAEAMAAGCPVIALDASGVREVVEDNRNGRLLPAAASTEDFAKALSDYFAAGELATRWRQSAQATAGEFDRLKAAQKLLDLYQRAQQQQLENAQEHHSFFKGWEHLLEGVKTEWDMLSSKVGAIADTFGPDDNDHRQ